MASADVIADQMIAAILKDLPFRAGDEVALLVNNLGATTQMELLIVARRAHQVAASARRLDSPQRRRRLPDLPGDGGHVDHADESRRRAEALSRHAGPIVRLFEGLSSDARHAFARGEARDMLAAVAREIVAKVDLLTEVDQAIGDGDHGIGMRRGFAAVLDETASIEPTSVAAVFKAVGTTVMGKTGGAAGAVFGTLFRAGSVAFEGHAELRRREPRRLPEHRPRRRRETRRRAAGP